MTVSSTIARNPYTGDGSTATYPYTFRIFDATDLVVVKKDAAGNETLLNYGTDYTVTGAGSYNGGSITLTAGNLPFGYTLTIRRVLDLLQATDLRNQGAFLAETHERVFDRLVMIAQQQEDDIVRCLRFPESDDAALLLPTKENRAGRGLAFDSNGHPIAGTIPSNGIISSAMQPVMSAATLLLAMAAMDPTQGAWPVKASGSSTARSLSSRTADVINVKDHGAIGDGVTTDTAAIQSAVNAAVAAGRGVYFPFGTYLTGTIFVNGYIPFIHGDQATLLGNLSRNNGGGFIDAATTAVTTQATAVAPGHLTGSCFYFTANWYGMKVYGLTFQEWRFALTWWTANAAPSIQRIKLINVNCGLICYQGSQNVTLEEYDTPSNVNVHVIAASTAFASGSALANQDNYYMDGMTIRNGSGRDTPSTTVNDYFDDWFIDSILRPTISSVSAATPGGYVYPYDRSTTWCRPSGRVLFAAFRNPRTCYGAHIGPLLTNSNWRGIAMINAEISGGKFHSIDYEGMFGPSPTWDAECVFSLGMTSNLGFDIMFANNKLSDGTHKLYQFSGNSPGGYSITLTNCVGTLFDDGQSHIQTSRVNGYDVSAPRHHVVTNRGTAPQQGAQDLNTFDSLSSNRDKWIYKGAEHEVIKARGRYIIPSPSDTTATAVWSNSIKLQNLQACGRLTVNVQNLATGAWDVGVFQIGGYNSSATTYTTTATLSNGHSFIAVSGLNIGNPAANPQCGDKVTIGANSYVVDYCDPDAGRIYLMAVVSVLGSPLASGQTVTFAARAATTITAFSQSWLTMTVNDGIVFTSSLCTKKTSSGASDNFPNGTSLAVYVTLEGCVKP